MNSIRNWVRAATASIVALAAAGAIAAAPGPAPAGAAPAADAGRYKVVVHVGDAEPAKWTVALNNVANLQKEVGAANIDIEVVAINAGLGMLKVDSPVGNRVAEALKSGVVIVACENSMRGQKLVREDMLNDIGYVKAGVVELMERQRQGYAYIRP
jgi:intracellular sulfur oxidation DsrE/DsrF family protein